MPPAKSAAAQRSRKRPAAVRAPTQPPGERNRKRLRLDDLELDGLADALSLDHKPTRRFTSKKGVTATSSSANACKREPRRVAEPSDSGDGDDDGAAEDADAAASDDEEEGSAGKNQRIR